MVRVLSPRLSAAALRAAWFVEDFREVGLGCVQRSWALDVQFGAAGRLGWASRWVMVHPRCGFGREVQPERRKCGRCGPGAGQGHHGAGRTGWP